MGKWNCLYYWFSHPVFGAPLWLDSVVHPLVTRGVPVLVLTWGALMLETLLATGLVMDRKWWPKLLIAGLAFHACIMIMHGLVSFFFSMAGALVLYLRPPEQEFSFVLKLADRARDLLPLPR